MKLFTNFIVCCSLKVFIKYLIFIKFVDFVVFHWTFNKNYL